MPRVVFMGTPEFALPSLHALIASHEVVGVVTQPDRPAGRGRQPQSPPVKLAAAAAGIPIYQPRSLRAEETAAPLRAWQPDIIVVAAFGQILRPHLLTLAPHGSLNVHASLLPRWRGASPIQHAILAGDGETGVSLMQMDEGLDTGPVYVAQAESIRLDDTAATLHDRLAELGADLLRRHLHDIVAGQLLAAAQDDSLATYAPLIKKESGRLDWRQSSAQLDRHVRAMTPWPGAFATWRGQNLKVLEAAPAAGVGPAGAPAQVVAFQENIAVTCGDGLLILHRLQLAGRRATAAADFVRGQPDFVGSSLAPPPDL